MIWITDMMVDWMVQVDGIGERNGMDRMVDRIDRMVWMI